MEKELKEIFDKWSMDYAIDAEYTDAELVKIQSDIIKRMYSDIEKLIYKTP